MSSQISIVIPVYNHAMELRDCLDALSLQTDQDFEVVAVDDGSTDGLSELAKTWKFSFPFRLIRFEKNRGAPAARNEGARQTSGDYLIFLDADATLTPTAIAQMRAVLDTHQEIDFVYPTIYFGWKLFPGRPFDAEALKVQNYIHTSALLRRRVFPGFDESLWKFQDWDLWLTMIARGSKGYWISEPLFRIKTRKTGYSHWLPKIAYRFPWHYFGWAPREVRRYREAEVIIRRKHQI